MTSTTLLPSLWTRYQPGVQSAAPGIVAGVPVLGSFVNFAAAALDVFIMPVQGYRKDGRCVGACSGGASTTRPGRRGFLKQGVPDAPVGGTDCRAASVFDGFRRGVNALVWTTAVETLNISFKIMMGTHVGSLRPRPCAPSRFSPAGSATDRTARWRPGVGMGWGAQVLLVAAENTIGTARPEPGAVTAVVLEQPEGFYDGEGSWCTPVDYVPLTTEVACAPRGGGGTGPGVGRASTGRVRAYANLSGRLVQTVDRVVWEPLQVYREAVCRVDTSPTVNGKGACWGRPPLTKARRL